MIETAPAGVRLTVVKITTDQPGLYGCPVMKNGYLYPNETPGWGIEVDEKLAAAAPFGTEAGVRGQLNGGWGILRRLDGTVIKQ